MATLSMAETLSCNWISAWKRRSDTWPMVLIAWRAARKVPTETDRNPPITTGAHAITSPTKAAVSAGTTRMELAVCAETALAK